MGGRSGGRGGAGGKAAGGSAGPKLSSVGAKPNSTAPRSGGPHPQPPRPQGTHSQPPGRGSNPNSSSHKTHGAPAPARPHAPVPTPVSNNRANQLNPNNHRYFQCRGQQQKPSEEQKQHEIAQRRLDGEIQARACRAAARPREERKAIARDTETIVKVVKNVVGAGTEVRKAGSVAKHTDVRGKSDLDLRYRPPDRAGAKQQVTKEQQQKLTQQLRAHGFPVQKVAKVHQVKGAKCAIDIVPVRAEYIPAGSGWKERDVMPNPFKDNEKARDVVRYLKDTDVCMLSKDIEKNVLLAQQARPGANRPEILQGFYEDTKKDGLIIDRLQAWDCGINVMCK